MPSTAVIYVKELDRMQAFYAGCFDLELEERTRNYAVLVSEHWELALVASKIASQIRPTDPPARRENVPVKLGFAVDSIEAARPTVQSLGGAVNDPATEWKFRGLLRCDAVDPEGNVIQLLQPCSPDSSS